ncbi:PREDICTED: protein FAM162A [Gavialis gangeticus]|uniref:protein FAM162A n=1 Tax=Gavialis gangeticus TaxID=94835 RepID=UPI00092EB67C|nr:PREDICTED: protein FAM162A [Gavialis gangeticus]
MGVLPVRPMTMLQKKVPLSLRLTKGMDLRIRRGFCSKSQEGINQNLKGQPSFKMPGHRPTDWDKRIFLWSGRFKKAEDIPETVSFEMIDAARSKLRVKMSYLMVVLTVLGCLAMAIQGKQTLKRHESLVSQNLEKKAR